jgi:hypothetical protein
MIIKEENPPLKDILEDINVSFSYYFLTPLFWG